MEVSDDKRSHGIHRTNRESLRLGKFRRVDELRHVGRRCLYHTWTKRTVKATQVLVADRSKTTRRLSTMTRSSGWD